MNFWMIRVCGHIHPLMQKITLFKWMTLSITNAHVKLGQGYMPCSICFCFMRSECPIPLRASTLISITTVNLLQPQKYTTRKLHNVLTDRRRNITYFVRPNWLITSNASTLVTINVSILSQPWTYTTKKLRYILMD